MKEEIRFKHAIMDYDYEIEYCKKNLASGVTGEERKGIEYRIKVAEKNKKKLLLNKDKLIEKNN